MVILVLTVAAAALVTVEAIDCKRKKNRDKTKAEMGENKERDKMFTVVIFSVVAESKCRSEAKSFIQSSAETTNVIHYQVYSLWFNIQNYDNHLGVFA